MPMCFKSEGVFYRGPRVKSRKIRRCSKSISGLPLRRRSHVNISKVWLRRTSWMRDAPRAFEGSRLAAKFQIAGHPTFSLCLCLVPGSAKASPRLAPIVGTFGSPGKIRRAHQSLKRPSGIIRNVGGKAKHTARPQRARQHRDGAILHESPLPMPTLRPWIRIEEIDLGNRGVREPSQEIDGVARVEPDVADCIRLDRGQDLGHAVDEGLTADEAICRM